MTNSERAAYIRGLMDGLELDPTAKETKLFKAIVDLLDDLCLSMEEMEDAYDELCGQVDEIDEDLGELEEEFYEFEDDDCDCDDCDCDCDDCDCDCDCDDDDDEFWEDDDCYFEVTCPSCGDTIELNGEMLDEGSIDCPNCGEHLEFDLDDEIAEEDDE
ncbi:MAG: hypothetical protein IIY04_03765 [Oscillospiraceae bacterium]|nr:hypothetical protein [Oscillospiraceae bacterium]